METHLIFHGYQLDYMINQSLLRPYGIRGHKSIEFGLSKGTVLCIVFVVEKGQSIWSNARVFAFRDVNFTVVIEVSIQGYKNA